MKKLTFEINESGDIYTMEFITDRGVDWTVDQYTRHRYGCTMNFISEEDTNETESTARKISKI